MSSSIILRRRRWYNDRMTNFNAMMSVGGLGAGFGPVLVLFVLWSLFWKGFSLWHSGRRAQPWWFVILLIVNTVGILDIIYIFAVAKVKPSELFSK